MVHPVPNLDPASQPWGKWISEDHDNLRTEVARNTNDNAATLQQLNGSITQLNSQVKALNAQIVYLNGLTTTSVVGVSINSGTIPGDSTFRYFNDGANTYIDVNVATGRLLCTYGAAEVSISGASTVGLVALDIYTVDSFGNTGTLVSSGSTGAQARLFSGSTSQIGASVSRNRVYQLTAGVYRIFIRLGTWAGLSNSASVNFAGPFVTAQVI